MTRREASNRRGDLPPKAGEPKLALEEGERGWFVDGFHFRSLPLGGEGSTGHRHAALVPSLTSPPGLLADLREAPLEPMGNVR